MRSLVSCLLLAIAIPPAAGQSLTRQEQAALRPISEYHYDQIFRESAFEAYRRGSFEWALRHFMAAARHADKTSQLAISNLYANGEGVPRDLALAYAWADVAAERGFPKFVARREALWAQLSEAERERAIAEGGKLYAEYGDAVAKKRHQSQLDRAVFRSMGLRPALRGTVETSVYAGCNGSGPVAASGIGGGSCFVPDYWENANWKSKDYWRVQDSVWSSGGGTVEVSPLRRDEDAPSDR